MPNLYVFTPDAADLATVHREECPRRENEPGSPEKWLGPFDSVIEACIAAQGFKLKAVAICGECKP